MEKTSELSNDQKTWKLRPIIFHRGSADILDWRCEALLALTVLENSGIVKRICQPAISQRFTSNLKIIIRLECIKEMMMNCERREAKSDV